ncbi:MAG TPA: 4-hydroxy-2-oxovalerate aldolase [Thermotogota bacterium]|nr:4-hydroxy-2-oxovalerate aldolase [Thermotogota bacterium]
MKSPKILETTLRDGSYAIDFSFTISDTKIICKELEDAGFEWIEIGHGVGLNASSSGRGKAVQTDEEYLQAASSVLKKAKFGMFCIPGIARLEDIDLAAKYQMGFIRIGTNVTEVPSSKEYVKRAKEHKMFVAANYMKSYALPPEKLAEQVKFSVDYGVDMIYIVDSAGGMFTEDVERYFHAVRSVSNIPIGFHGHDNLGMALANSLKIVELGAEFVDSSLQGLGRSSGNVATELLVMSLLKKGYDCPIDLGKVISIGQKYIYPYFDHGGKSSLDMIAGYADFHSSYMPLIQKAASKYNIDPIKLIIEVTKVDKVHIDEEKLDSIAAKIEEKTEDYLGKYHFHRYVGEEEYDWQRL